MRPTQGPPGLAVARAPRPRLVRRGPAAGAARLSASPGPQTALQTRPGPSQVGPGRERRPPRSAAAPCSRPAARRCDKTRTCCRSPWVPSWKTLEVPPWPPPHTRELAPSRCRPAARLRKRRARPRTVSRPTQVPPPAPSRFHHEASPLAWKWTHGMFCSCADQADGSANGWWGLDSGCH